MEPVHQKSWLSGESLRSLLYASEETDRTLFEFQLRLFPRLVQIGIALQALSLIRNLATGTGPTYLNLAIIILLSLALVVVHRRPSLLRPVVRVVVTLLLAMLAGSMAWWQGNTVLPPLALVPLLGLAAATLDGLILGLVFSAASGALLGWLAIASGSDMTRGMAVELLLVVAAMAGGYLGFTLILRRLVQRYRDQGARMESETNIRETLLTALFERLKEPLDRFQRALGRENPFSLDEVRESAAAMQDTIQETRALTLESSSRLNTPLLTGRQELARLRASLLTLFSLLGAILLPALAWRSTGTPGTAWGRCLAAFLAVLPFIAAARLPRLVPAASMGVLVVASAAISWISLGQLSSTASMPAVVHLLPLIFFSLLMTHVLVAASVTLAGLGLAATWFVAGRPMDASVQQLVINIAICLVVVFSVCLVLWIWIREMVARMDDRAMGLRAEGDMRHRLMTTLFHDLRNPLTVIASLLEPASRAPDPSATQRLERMGGRMANLLAMAQRYHTFQGQVPDALKPVKISDLFEACRDLFQERIAQKKLTLAFAGEQDAHLHCLPELLIDSVLSNLLSNAVKFSPEGTAIRVEAAVYGDEVRVSISDQGRGFRESQLEKLRAGQWPESTEGTGGEEGDGQGLRLASVYLAHMGGRLEFENGAQGGGRVTVAARRAVTGDPPSSAS